MVDVYSLRGKPVVGQHFTFHDGRKGRVVSVSLTTKDTFLGHHSFKEWFDRFDRYVLSVSYATSRGDIRTETVWVDK